MWSWFDTAPIVAMQPSGDHAKLARTEADLSIARVSADQLGVGAGGACDLATLHRLHLDIVDDGADRQGAQGRGVARLHVDLLAGDDLVAGFEALRREDVVQLAVGIL